MSNQNGADDHLDGLESGAGCTEIWERLSEKREQAGDRVADE